MQGGEDYVAMQCSYSGDDMKQGDHVWSLEDSSIGPRGFVPLSERAGCLVFSSIEHLIDFHIPGDFQMCTEGSFLVHSQSPCLDPPETFCENGGCALRYGMRALRVVHGQLDCASVHAATPGDSVLFCSKACVDEYFEVRHGD